jgi:hypothetical protein
MKALQKGQLLNMLCTSLRHCGLMMMEDIHILNYLQRRVLGCLYIINNPERNRMNHKLHHKECIFLLKDSFNLDIPSREVSLKSKGFGKLCTLCHWCN